MNHTSVTQETAAPASSKSAWELVFHGILKELDNWSLVPGQRLVETDLVERFQVGRNSVREALQRLAAEGIVVLSPNKGASIKQLNLQDMLDVLSVAESLFGLLAKTAVRGVGNLAAMAALDDAMAALAQAEKARDSAAFSRARRMFYRALLEMGGNKELQRLLPAIVMPIVHAHHRLPDFLTMRLADYRRIAKAVVSGHAKQAEAAACKHVENVRQAVVAAFAQPPM
ncbi:GntR family transcriptional regulator [Lampropedia aestuarii]|uniref:GntR family transcriptional regulator n=1 Tax=Lampropedia aestuarii TaxID=2562762 RepID=UPI002468D415|nr:GntR family transcriptional regulator [Lampropedia aestuarii]MDH5858271.1 GntR family transcriptional regulator [Lampropedia aestuarii]